MKPHLIAAALAASLIAASSPGGAFAQPAAPAPEGAAVKTGPIEVVVWNIRRGLGHVRVAICTSLTFADAHKSCPYHGEATAHAGVTTVVVPDVPAGTYAAEVYQDDDDSGVLRRGPLGVPLEGVGFSNDVTIRLRPPRFWDAAFDYDPATALSLRIKLRYFPGF
jgi:uncharacterized protein (DUF2141 family)